MITNIVEFLAASEMVRDIAIVAVIGGAIYFYKKAVNSRKYYKCPHCGESFRVEFMDAAHCKACGAPVEKISDENTSDKTH